MPIFPYDSVDLNYSFSGASTSTGPTFNATSTILYTNFSSSDNTAGDTFYLACMQSGEPDIILANVRGLNSTPNMDELHFDSCPPGSQLNAQIMGAAAGVRTSYTVIYVPRDLKNPQQTNTNLNSLSFDSLYLIVAVLVFLLSIPVWQRLMTVTSRSYDI